MRPIALPKLQGEQVTPNYHTIIEWNPKKEIGAQEPRMLVDELQEV